MCLPLIFYTTIRETQPKRNNQFLSIFILKPAIAVIKYVFNDIMKLIRINTKRS